MVSFPPGKNKAQVLIGQGHYGKLRLAYHLERGRFAAVKKIKGDREIQISKDEGALQTELSGEPNVLSLWDYVETEDGQGRAVLYQFMPLAGLGDGRALQQLLTQLSSLGRVTLATWMGKDLLTGLLSCHRHGIFHLDVKPENVVFTQEGEGYLTDFGCAKRSVALSPLIPFNSLGDTRYFSPERFQAARDRQPFDASKVDSWAAGLTLLEWTKGERVTSLLALPTRSVDRFHCCDAAFFEEQLACISELNNPMPGTLFALIKELLAIYPEQRLSLNDALKANCFVALDPAARPALFARLQKRQTHQREPAHAPAYDPKTWVQEYRLPPNLSTPQYGSLERVRSSLQPKASPTPTHKEQEEAYSGSLN